jgi:hypothetical protein
LRRFFDYLGVLFGITTVVGFGLAWYWHAQSVQERAPTYQVSPQRVKLVDTSIPVPSQLQVLYRGKDLNKNVTALTLYLWNDGKLPIKAEDVLQPLEVRLDPDAEILDARILRVSRPVTKFATGEILESKRNSLPLSFAILEKGDGAALQIIYTGKPDAAVSVLGTIVGAGEPRKAHTSQVKLVRTQGEAIRGARETSYYLVAICVGVAIFAGLPVFFLRRLPPDHQARAMLPPLTTIAFTSVLGVVVTFELLVAVNFAAASPVPTAILMED